MNYSEFRLMTTALERYYKDVKIAILTGKREAKDLDMRFVLTPLKSRVYKFSVSGTPSPQLLWSIL